MPMSRKGLSRRKWFMSDDHLRNAITINHIWWSLTEPIRHVTDNVLHSRCGLFWICLRFSSSTRSPFPPRHHLGLNRLSPKNPNGTSLINVNFSNPISNHFQHSVKSITPQNGMAIFPHARPHQFPDFRENKANQRKQFYFVSNQERAYSHRRVDTQTHRDKQKEKLFRFCDFHFLGDADVRMGAKLGKRGRESGWKRGVGGWEGHTREIIKIKSHEPWSPLATKLNCKTMSRSACMCLCVSAFKVQWIHTEIWWNKK